MSEYDDAIATVGCAAVAGLAVILVAFLALGFLLGKLL